MKPSIFALLIPIGAFLATALSFADDSNSSIVKDRKGFFPERKQVPVKGTAIGILLADGQPILSLEGRSGPADQLVFSANGNSYRWVYVPTQDNPQITNLQVPAGEDGQQKQIYPALNLANPRSVIPWAITKPYTLVEVEVNGGQGSPSQDSFVVTKFRVLEGTKEYPLKVNEVINKVKQMYAESLNKKQEVIDRAMKETAQKSLSGKPPTGPREKKELMYVTWMPETSILRVHFKTTITDGAYTFVNMGEPGPIQRDPPPLPVKPLPLKQARALRAPPLRNVPMKTGTTFGIEFGQAYLVDRQGQVAGTEELPIESFTQQLNAFPGRRLPPNPVPGADPVPVPLPAAPVKDSQ